MQVLTPRDTSPLDKGSKPVPSRACDSCRQKKIKCDRVLPQCDWCRHHNRICTFSRPTQRRGKKNLEHLGLELERRILVIEKALTDKLMGDNLQKRESVKPNPVPRESHLSLQLVGQWVGMVNSYNGFPFFSPEGQKWVQECTGQRIRFPSISSGDSPQTEAPPLHEIPLPPTEIELSSYLPSKQSLLEHVELWNASLMGEIFPLFTESEIQTIIHTAYSEETTVGSLEEISAQCFLHAFIAFTTIFGMRSPSEQQPFDGPACAAKAQQLLGQLMWMPTTIGTLQAIIMLAYFDAVRGGLKSVDMLISMGSRIAFFFGAHKCRGTEAEESESSTTLRNLFWLLFVLDKDMSIRTGRPHCIPDAQCDLTLPDNENDIDADHQPRQHSLKSTRFRLSIIKSRAFDSLYSVHALQKSDAELLRTIILLDDELEQWRASVPAPWRPPLAFSLPKPEEPRSKNIGPPEVALVLTQLEYFHCAAIIHQASSRCQAWDSTGQPVKGVRSSSDLSAAASRSTLEYLIQISDSLQGHAFWLVLLYATSAVLTIFCHILSYPLSPSAAHDISFLQNAPAILHYRRSLSNDVLLPHEALRLKAVTDFLEDLANLAPLAINKAKAAEAHLSPEH